MAKDKESDRGYGVVLKTGISEAFWCQRDGEFARFGPAEVAIGGTEPAAIAWFDELFRGGIYVPKSKSRPLTILITGPPGSGKTTLTLELCYRMAKNSGAFSLYLSTESEEQTLINNAKAYGYADVNKIIKPFHAYTPAQATVTVREVQGFQNSNGLAKTIADTLQELTKWLTKAPPGLVKQITTLLTKWNRGASIPRGLSPYALVFDSLNVVPSEQARDFFEDVLKRVSGKTNLVFFVLDSGVGAREHETWEYVCDTVIRLDYAAYADYYVRTIEIIKARYQEHVWGKHQLKIYPQFDGPVRSKTPKIREQLRRAHPYRKEGGIFIFPSIHYYLSKYKRVEPPSSADFVDTKPTELNNVLGRPDYSGGTGGLPQGRCTAFIGSRGGHKSHLAYLHLLHRMLSPVQEAGLIISLRDDEDMTRRALGRIMRQERIASKEEDLEKLEHEDRLEVLYYHPGYITPEEFFHRLFMSVQRLKKSGKPLTVLFNSLDQLSARFPLCARQEIFIPGIINLLSGEGITSIFIGVEEPGQPLEQYGLLPMADLILSFDRRSFEFADYYGHIKETRGFPEGIQSRVNGILKAAGGSIREEIILAVVRFAGGQRGGAKGLLELVEERDIESSLYSESGLHFTLLSDKYPPGTRMEGGRWSIIAPITNG